MQTLVLTKKDIQQAGTIIRNGGLVAFPTETVYGLGANALDENAVKKIFEAKGRPADNPLIVHIAEVSDLEKYAKNIPPIAYTLIERFWPGALTVVLEKKSIVPDITTAGLSTICLRMPNHDIALRLIRESGVPLAGPSANTSGRPSPTDATHVLEDMDGKIDAIIQDEVSDIGIESTVLDLTVSPPVILRHGGVTEEMLSELTELGEVIEGKTIKSPGTKYRHYAPDLDIIIGKKIDERFILERIKQGENIGYIGIGKITYTHPHIFMEKGLEDFSQHLFDTFRKAEKLGLKKLYVQDVGEGGIAKGIMNRVGKAASGR